MGFHPATLCKVKRFELLFFQIPDAVAFALGAGTLLIGVLGGLPLVPTAHTVKSSQVFISHRLFSFKRAQDERPLCRSASAKPASSAC